MQTVHQDSNSKFFNLIRAFKEKTQSSVLINTSFNIRGEPIVCSPTDAYRCFMKTNMDVLVIGNFLLLKENQIKNDLLNYTTEELGGKLDLSNQTEVRKKDILIFSLILALAAVFISYRYFFNNPNAMKFFILFISFLIVTPFVNYKLLITPYRKWMLLGKKMGEYKFRLFTFILYFLVLSPYGLFIRFFVNSPLKLKIDTNKTSYFQNEFDTNQAKP